EFRRVLFRSRLHTCRCTLRFLNFLARCFDSGAVLLTATTDETRLSCRLACAPLVSIVKGHPQCPDQSFMLSVTPHSLPPPPVSAQEFCGKSSRHRRERNRHREATRPTSVRHRGPSRVRSRQAACRARWFA